MRDIWYKIIYLRVTQPYKKANIHYSAEEFLNDTFDTYKAFQIDEPHRHNKNLVGKFYGRSLLWPTQMKTAVND